MSEYNWVIALIIPVLIALIFFLLDKKNSGLVIIAFLNIGFALMVYAELLDIGILITNAIITLILIFITRKGNN